MSRKNLFFALILLFAFLLRLWFSTFTFHTDQIIQASWGQYIYKHGSQNLYTENNWVFSWPNDPPLTSLYYGWSFHAYRFFSLYLHRLNLHLSFLPFNNFVSAFDNIVSPEIPIAYGYLLTMKLWPIIADIFIAIIIFQLSKKLLYPSLYLFSPFSFYISSFWGQTNQIGFLFVFLSFLITPRHLFYSLILFYLGTSIKPTSLILVPLYIFLIYRSKPKIIPLLTGISSCLLLTYLTLHSFTISPVELITKVFNRPDRLTTNAYNFWHIFTLNTPTTPNLITKIISYLSFTFINLFAFKSLKKLGPKNIIFALFIVSFGGWLFLTNMLDRYSFTGIVASLILCSYYPHTLRYWLPLSLIFWLNLFRLWWFPSLLEPLKLILTHSQYLIGLPLSLANILLFVKLVQKKPISLIN